MLRIWGRKLANGPPRRPHRAAEHGHHRQTGSPLAADHDRSRLFARVEGDLLHRDEVLAKYSTISVEDAVQAGLDQLARVLELVDAYRGCERLAIPATSKAGRRVGHE